LTKKWGFGIEKETVLIGYDKGLKNFSDKVRGRTGTYTHDQRQALPIGNYTVSTSDMTVRSNGGSNGYEFETRDSVVTKKPINTIKGFIHDVNKRAKEEVINGEIKKPIPFGSVPGVASREYGQKVPGSYHLNLTMPHETNMSQEEIKKYKEKLKKGLLNTRLMMPLLLAMTGGTTSDSIGKPSLLEGSQRQLYNDYVSGIGYADLSEGTTIDRGVDDVFDSDRYPDKNHQSWRSELREKFQEISKPKFTDIRTKKYKETASTLHGKLPTIEFRFLDTFDTRGLYDVFASISTIMANGGKTSKFKDPEKKRVWVNAMKSIAKEGWNAYVNEEFVKYIEKNMKINLNIHTKKVRADLLFNKIMDELWKKNKNDEWVKPWIDTSKKPEVHNFNKDSWEFYALQKVKEDEGFRNKLLKLLMVIQNIDASKSNGWIKVNWKNNLYGARDLILDDTIMGKEYGAEDTEDLLHFLKRYNFLELKIDASGRINSIKKKFNSKEDIKKLLKKMLEEKEMLNENGKGLIKVEEIQEEEPIEEIQEEEPQQTEETPTQTTTGNSVTINGLSFNIVETNDEDANYNLDDLKQVLRTAEFTKNGSYINWEVKFADVIKVIIGQNGATTTLYLPQSYIPIENLSGLIRKMKEDGIYKIESGARFTPTQPTDLPNEMFFRKLMGLARNEYRKTSHQIELSRAGIQTLKNKGIYILSYKRGKKYFIGNNEKAKRLMGTEGMKILNYIPYQKNMFVEINRDSIRLKKGRIIVDSIRRT